MLPFKMGISPTLKIRGIIATRDIKKNTVIERCPVVLVDVKYEDFLEKTYLANYYYLWDDQYHAIVLGYGSIFNHSKNHNVKYSQDEKNKIMIYETIRDIKNGEELTVDYSDGLDEVYPEHVDFHKQIGELGL